MTHSDDDYDPDDNFAKLGASGMEVDDEASTEALVWQLLLLVNPDDEESALQQFGAWQERLAESGPEDAEPLLLLREVVDWKSGFHVEASDPAGLIECIDELAARWSLRIDWGLDDASGDEGLRHADTGSLLSLAHGRLREHGYSLWTWNPRGEAREDAYAGWITLRRDEEAMLVLAHALAIELRPGSAH
jgi:hypothetical protein